MSSGIFKNIDTLCLASASPRRRELAEKFGLNIKIIHAGAEEIPGAGSPEEIAAGLAYQKAQAAVKEYVPAKHEVILTADTSVWLNGQMFGKPSGAPEAASMLRLLSGAEHEVITGCVLMYRTGDNICASGRGSALQDRSVQETACSGRSGVSAVNSAAVPRIEAVSFSEVTRVTVDGLSDEEIEAYISSGDPFDKAGAYGIQGAFAVHVSRIEGCYNNVVGLPVNAVYQKLKEIDEFLERSKANDRFRRSFL